MFLTLSQYIQSLRAVDTAGDKDRKINGLIEYYDRHISNVSSTPGTFFAVIYARFSSHRQRDESIEGQVRECLEFAARKKIAVLGVYMDRAITGKEADRRESFQQMIKDAAREKWQYVICWKVDRFARNRYDAATYKAKLKKHNIRVLYAREDIPEGPEGILLESVLEGQAEYYSASLSENIRRGQMDNALEGKINGGAASLGYRITPDHHLEIDPATAPIVRTAFEMRAAGSTIKEIAGHLNARGYKTRLGNAFNKNSFRKMLASEKYIGIYRYRDVVIEIPAIIEKELFDTVQEINEKSSKARARKKSEVEFLLTTKIICGRCGTDMIGDSGTGKSGKRHYYYTCSGHRRKSACKAKSIQKDWIENLVIETTVKQVLVPSVIEKIADGVIEYQAKENNHSTLKRLKEQLKNTQKSIQNILTAIEQGIITPSTKSRLEELEDEKQRLQVGIMEESMVQPTVTKEQVLFFLDQFRNGDVSDPAYRQRLIDVFVHAVYVYDDKVVIVYNYSGGGNDRSKITLSDIQPVLDEWEDTEETAGGSVRIEPTNVHQAEPGRDSRSRLGFFFCLVARVFSRYLFCQGFPQLR